MIGSLKKEFLLMLRNPHSLLALFLMPAIFILIMSLAMQGAMDSRGLKIDFSVIDKDASDISAQLKEKLLAIPGGVETRLSGQECADSLVGADTFQFAVLIPDGFHRQFETLTGTPDPAESLQLFIYPGTHANAKMLFEARLKKIVGEIRMQRLLRGLTSIDPAFGAIDAEAFAKAPLTVRYAAKEGRDAVIPSAVQLSVPAWLIFSMFFVIIPISTILITERDMGTLIRLKSMRVPAWVYFGGKFVPYFIINHLQMWIMLGVGIYLVPLFGGQALTLGPSIIGLIGMGLGTSFAAIGLAFLIAVISKSIEQATTIGGLGNIILGAVGGVMVPKFVMPESMQQATALSPMAWSLDGFLQLFTAQAGLIDVLPNIGALLLFGLSMFLGAFNLFYKRI